jgi:D-glycero-D-manno-heptose 1,7-bisphosphate phosphatase
VALGLSTRAVFLDKDGTLIENVPYNVNPELIRFARGAEHCLMRLSEAGYRIFVVTNQSGVARALFPESALDAVEQRIREQMARVGVDLAGFYYCPHAAPKDTTSGLSCECRKPSPGLLQRAAEEHGISLAESWLVGDIVDDIQAGRRAGCHTVLLRPADEPQDRLREHPPCYLADDLADAADGILWNGGECMHGEHLIKAGVAH